MKSVVYSLQGESLNIAKRIHEAHKKSMEEYEEIEAEVEEFRQNLIAKFDQKHDETFRGLFSEMAHALCIPKHQIKEYNLDCTYLDSHNMAFFQQGPIQDNVLVMNVDQRIPAAEFLE